MSGGKLTTCGVPRPRAGTGDRLRAKAERIRAEREACRPRVVRTSPCPVMSVVYAVQRLAGR